MSVVQLTAYQGCSLCPGVSNLLFSHPNVEMYMGNQMDPDLQFAKSASFEFEMKNELGDHFCGSLGSFFLHSSVY